VKVAETFIHQKTNCRC